ncbi:dTDP-4-dehydrorhamnose reductase [Sciscionella sediminilitoris]|uniref:dTDP-4-dehydrorhamnose reductase n=1 Tax=Sciscionella sediminilitoris TaxID=1445613 RepID=UPI0004DF43B3|nr:dTDP-4-dehydrorhamnose reductase [Sciscionella sp. SE31]
MTEVLVTGARGQLGSDLAAKTATNWAYSSAELDITEEASVKARLAEFAGAGGSVLFNAAAYTAVDKAESDVDAAFAVNARGPELIANACAEFGIACVHVSTDYVFGGDADRPYEPADPTAPNSVYGRSKLAGEQAVLAAGGHVVRTAWVYGAHGHNFVKTMLRLQRERETLTVVDDQHGTPTWSADLADGLLELAAALGERELPQVLHASGSGQTTWCGFAKAIFTEVGADPDRVRPCTTEEFPSPTPRPAYSVLGDDAWRAAGLTPLPDWRDALHRAYAAGSFG